MNEKKKQRKKFNKKKGFVHREIERGEGEIERGHEIEQKAA